MAVYLAPLAERSNRAFTLSALDCVIIQCPKEIRMQVEAAASSGYTAQASKASEAKERPGPDHDRDEDDAKAEAIKSATSPGTGRAVDVSA
jgi:hypothetical protein